MKLLFILLLGLGFTQTELTTRVYAYNASFLEQVEYELSLFDITNGELDDSNFAILYLMQANNITSSNNNWVSIKVRTYVGGGSWAEPTLGQIFTSSGAVVQHNHLTYDSSTANYKFLTEGDISAEFIFAITAEFPIEDTGYIEEGFEFCVSPGANLLSFPCDNPISVEESLPSGVENFIYSIIGEGVATSYDSSLGWVGSLTNFDPGSGYWFKSNSSLCFEYECVED